MPFTPTGTGKSGLEIMKDPHTGAFALICTAVYVLPVRRRSGGIYPPGRSKKRRLFVAVAGGLPGDGAGFFRSGRPDISQSQGGRAGGLLFPGSKGRGRISGCLSGGFWSWKGGAVWAAGPGAGILGLVQLGVFLYFRRMAMREFGGITGDLAGWFLQICELISLCASLLFMRMGIL